MIPTDLDLFSKIASSLFIALFGSVWLFHLIGSLKTIRFYFLWLRTLPRPRTALFILANLYIPLCLFIPYRIRVESIVLDILFNIVLVVTLTAIFISGTYHGILTGIATVKKIRQFRIWKKALLLAVPLDLWVFWLMRG